MKKNKRPTGSETSKSKNILIDFRVVYDTREQDTEYLVKKELLDKRRGKDKTKIIELKKDTVKPLTATKSTGDITLEYRIAGGEWRKTTLSIEVKKGADLFTTLFSNKKRFYKELDRAKGLDFWVLHDQDFVSFKEYADNLYVRSGGKAKVSFPAFGDAYLELLENNQRVVCATGNKGLAIAIRRLCKRHWRKNSRKYLKEEKNCTKR